MIWGSQQQAGEPDYFFWDLLRKYVVVFGRTFSDIVIQRSLANNVITNIKVPLEYAAKDKTIVRLEGDPDLDRPFSALLPIMTFELGSPAIQYDPSQRKVGSLVKQSYNYTANNNQLQIMYSPVPYNINFNLFIYVKNQEDGARIIEQILPFFQPDWTPQVELIPQLNEVRNIPIELGAVSTEDLYDKDFKERRLILYTIPFKVRAWFYGPLRDKPVIKFVQQNVYAGMFTNNQVTINYTNCNGNFQSNTNVFAYYANNAMKANGVIYLASYMSPSNSGILVINTVSGSFANANTIYASSNSIVASIPTVNGFINGVYSNNGYLIPNPTWDESVIAQPGKTANGQATSNVAASVNVQLINILDDYGFATQTLGMTSIPVANTIVPTP